MLIKLQGTAGNAAVNRLLDRGVGDNGVTSGTDLAVGAGTYRAGIGAGPQPLAHDPGYLMPRPSHAPLAQRSPKPGATKSRPASTDPPELQLANIQGHAMDALLPELKGLEASVRTDEALGQRVGGPRLVMAMQAVQAKTQGTAWRTFLDAKKGDFLAWPPDQVVSILTFLGATAQDARKRFVLVWLHDLVTNAQGDLPLTSQARERLIGTTVGQMSSGYALMGDLVQEVRQRVLLSLYMQKTQKGTKTKGGLAKGFSYPDRPGDGTKGVQARVNEAALAYWGPRQGPVDEYFFELSPAGKADAHAAIVSLFKEQTDPHLRTLIHCDYLVSVIEYRAWAETIGVEKFNENVKLGNIPLVLKFNGFSDLRKTLSLSEMPKSPTLTTETPLKKITVGSESDLKIGDHVVFYNDPTYSALTVGDPDVWRLENAIVVDSGPGGHLYQGHGYSSPVPKSALMDAMCNKYNLHVRRALNLINAEKAAKTKKQREAAELQRRKLYPNVYPKGTGGKWEVAGASDLARRVVTRELMPLTPSTAPGLHDPADGLIWVRRPDRGAGSAGP